MTYKEYLDTLTPLSKEIMLLEGTRKLMDADAPKLTALAQRLAAEYPNTIFRTGNATGSDEAFARGVAMVDVTRLEYVLPSPGMGKKRLIPNARVISLEDLSKEELNHLVEKTLEATPNYRYLVDCYRKGIRNRHAESAKLLIRDILKVYGSKANGFLPATTAIFYVNFENPKGGGTGHTVRACVQRQIPFFTQMQWLEE
ncbi:MAG: hypothetical protein U0T69_10940 [Chitinophagales bacterium]